MFYVALVSVVLCVCACIFALVVTLKAREQRELLVTIDECNADLREQVTVDAERIAQLESLRDAYAEQIADLNEQVDRLTQRIDAYENDGDDSYDDSYDQDCYEASYEGE